MIIYIRVRDIQNIDFGQAFSNEDNCILSLGVQYESKLNKFNKFELIFLIINKEKSYNEN